MEWSRHLLLPFKAGVMLWGALPETVKLMAGTYIAPTWQTTSCVISLFRPLQYNWWKKGKGSQFHGPSTLQKAHYGFIMAALNVHHYASAASHACGRSLVWKSTDVSCWAGKRRFAKSAWKPRPSSANKWRLRGGRIQRGSGRAALQEEHFNTCRESDWSFNGLTMPPCRRQTHRPCPGWRTQL